MQISLVSPISNLAATRTYAEIDVLLRDARPWLYRLALAITTKPDMAEDVTQDALLRATRSRDKLRSAAEPRAWLRTIVVRCALTALGKAASLPFEDRAVIADPTDSVAVQITLARLDPTDRVLLALAHFEELSYSEIGELLEVPVGTVASRLHAAREAFRKEWRK